jgi:hypothetical protein
MTGKATDTLHGIWRFLERRIGRDGPWEPKTVLTHTAFERELFRQRAYSDRTGSRFVLLRLWIEPPWGQAADRADALTQVAGLLLKRIRLSDIPGWLDARRQTLGVILCGTRIDGATGVARAIAETFAERARSRYANANALPTLSFEAAPYPTEEEDGAAVSPGDVPGEERGREAPP